MKKFKSVLFGFASAIAIAWVGNFFYDSTKNIPILKYVTIFLRWVYNSLINILVFPVKTWWLLAAGLIAYWLYKLIGKRESSSPEFINYREDVFKKWIWRWDWKPTSNGWAVTNLIPYCPIDDVQLIDSSGVFDSSAYCPKCNRRFGQYAEPIEYPQDTRILIQDKVKKQAYPKNTRNNN